MKWTERYGEWALVTGASDGIGRACALALAARGQNVILVARRGDRLERVATEVRSAGAEARAIPADLSHAGGPGLVLDAVRNLDVGLYVGSAGFGTSGAFLDADLDTERGMVAVNVTAMMELTLGVARMLKERGFGGMVLLSSIVAFQGVPWSASYAATKAYVQTLAEGIRPELKRHGVEVLAVAPAMVDSGFAERSGLRTGAAATPETVARGAFRALGRRTTVRPGLLATFLEIALKLPRSLRSRIMGIVMGGMTAHKRA